MSKYNERKTGYLPIQKITYIDYQLVMCIGQQIGNKMCKIDGK